MTSLSVDLRAKWGKIWETSKNLSKFQCFFPHNDLKKDAINEFGIIYWTSNTVWVKFQEYESSFNVNIEEKVWLLVKKILTWKDWQGRLKLRFLTEIGRFHWNQGKKVAHFAWFGEPWLVYIVFYSQCYWNDLCSTMYVQRRSLS